MNNGDMPANPQSGAEQWDSSDYGGRGFTKREEMAKHLMSGLLASSVTASADEFAKRAVQAADALLKALESEQ